jgi:hypothetical protein
MGDKLIVNWKSICKERSWPNFKVLSEHSLGGTEGNHEPQNNWTLGGGFNTGLLEYNAGVLTTRLKTFGGTRHVSEASLGNTGNGGFFCVKTLYLRHIHMIRKGILLRSFSGI